MPRTRQPAEIVHITTGHPLSLLFCWGNCYKSISRLFREDTMSGLTRRFGIILLLSAFISSCSSTPAELVAKHTKRGDAYVAQGKFNEAVIEYKNAVQGGPNDSGLRLKLAMAALEGKDIRTAFQELQKAG